MCTMIAFPMYVTQREAIDVAGKNAPGESGRLACDAFRTRYSSLR